MNMFALSDTDQGEWGGGEGLGVRRGYTGFGTLPPPKKKKTKKYPNSIKIRKF